MTVPALSIEGLGKVFKSDLLKRNLEATRDVSFEVRPGEIFGFVGHNGAGKTTTMKIIMGLISATTGSVRIFGVDSRNPAARRPVGYLPEQPYFYEYLTPLEALEFYGGLSGISREVLKKRIPEVLAEVNLEFAADRRLRTFSKGMQQRLGMAQALVHDPQLLILDEPMSGLDPVGRKLMRDIIMRQREAGRTVCFSSHVLSDVEELSDRVGIIIRGKMRSVGEIHDLLGPAERFELGFKDLSPQDAAALQPMGVLRTQGEWRYLTVENDVACKQAQEVARQRGLTLLHLGSKRKTLEELFVEAMHTN